ncbi:LOW QUALITY PROTEIN: hypothetical protein PHMEG_00035452 [Phytophthora megakarya]|uniref:Uncharacterized protein n=1 Tax=Phytophthora megakarya TaxID=4795 RepID=A0A225UQD0_9STRA|nr:LOW QUALITY PROTEIN: hypothetical protein PHMEG_00035452 [Phytophthora megakarya]
MSGHYAVDSAWDVRMSIPQTMFEIIRPHELSSWEHAALIEWHRDWQRYVKKIRYHCSTTVETFRKDVATVKGSVKPHRADSSKDGPSRSDAPTAPTRLVPARASQPMRDSHLSPVRPLPHSFRFARGPTGSKNAPRLTGAQREEAQRMFREAKEQCLSVLRSKYARYVTPAGTVCVNGLLEVSYKPDTGVDKSIVPQNIVESQLAVQPMLVATPLNTQVEAEIVNGGIVLCHKKILLNLELSVVAGMGFIRSVPCLILSGDGDNFLLGRDALKGLGIDTTFTTDVDEVPVGDALPVVQEVRAVDDGAKQLVVQAVVNGMPVRYMATAHRILADPLDVWRATISPEPPALVKPLGVTLQVDSRPHRSHRVVMYLSTHNLFVSMWECWLLMVSLSRTMHLAERVPWCRLASKDRAISST